MPDPTPFTQNYQVNVLVLCLLTRPWSVIQ